jgi:hypothetical protein
MKKPEAPQTFRQAIILWKVLTKFCKTFVSSTFRDDLPAQT